jgi:hypothetical protein
MNLPEQNCSFCEGHIARRHVRIDDRVVCPSREMMKHNLRQFYCEGFHKPAEMTAERLGLELALPEKPLLERLIERGHETEETPPVNLPPVGPWDCRERDRATPEKFSFVLFSILTITRYLSSYFVLLHLGFPRDGMTHRSYQVRQIASDATSALY